MDLTPPKRLVHWVRSSRAGLKEMPEEVQEVIDKSNWERIPKTPKSYRAFTARVFWKSKMIMTATLTGTFTKSENFTFNLDDVRVPQKFCRERNNMRGANPGDGWEFSHVQYSNPNRQDHLTQKPEGLIEQMVLASSNPGELVLDPFAGSGTTLRACQQLQRVDDLPGRSGQSDRASGRRSPHKAL